MALAGIVQASNPRIQRTALRAAVDRHRVIGPIQKWRNRMKVRELIAGLQELNPELEVLGYTEDEPEVAPGHGLRLFEIDGVSVIEGEKTRTDDQIPSLKLGKGPHSQEHAIIELTADF